MQATAEELEQNKEVVERLGTPIEVSYQEMQTQFQEQRRKWLG